jgi:hypothetical protein
MLRRFSWAQAQTQNLLTATTFMALNNGVKVGRRRFTASKPVLNLETAYGFSA